MIHNHRIVIAAIAAMLAAPATAQSLPPPVPRYNCGLTPADQAQALELAAEAYRNRDIAAMSMLSGVLQGWQQGCQQDYQRRMLEWQAEMQRYEIQRRYGN